MIQKVKITVSDPWSFNDENGSPHLFGLANLGEVDDLTVDLSETYQFQGKSFDRVFVRARLEGSSLADLGSGLAIPANIGIGGSTFMVGSIILKDEQT